ncbi:MAG: M23 family metallopeptidase [Allosphingosinicella sp.]
MDRVRIILIVAVTAFLSAALTSAFWLVAFNRGSVAERSATAGEDGQEQDATRPPVPQQPTAVIGPGGLAVPVAGVQPDDLVDTYTHSRAGGARVHNAIDIMADHGTPVLAAAPGTVEKLYFSEGGGGTSVYVRSPDGRWIYYYAHLQAYAPGLAEGQQVTRGQVLGTVGSSGNASPEGPHLHFAVHRMAEGESWHEGTAVNPYPLLAGRRSGG